MSKMILIFFTSYILSATKFPIFAGEETVEDGPQLAHCNVCKKRFPSSGDTICSLCNQAFNNQVTNTKNSEEVSNFFLLTIYVVHASLLRMPKEIKCPADTINEFELHDSL